jgi:hypothetical protein
VNQVRDARVGEFARFGQALQLGHGVLGAGCRSVGRFRIMLLECPPCLGFGLKCCSVKFRWRAVATGDQEQESPGEDKTCCNGAS